ncbi:adenylate/guanylate cyclase domain-containing protein [Shimia sp.]|uniref:adenylate/guanylate cyclase domain-containing protein n=1 Tax=Shimia sp. TaxID=1954381 RepID=UPI00329716C3
MSEKVTRKLTTILSADAAGFSTAMDLDEEGTYADLHAARAVFAKLIERHDGRIANTAGDGLIAEFPSVVEAVQCAIEAQQELGLREQGLQFRIGVHLGDVIVDGEDLIGEGVNLAARLQTMAEPGGVLISQQVYDQVHAKLSIGFEYLGEQRPKNLTEDVPIYRVSTGVRQKKTFQKNRPNKKPHETPDIGVQRFPPTGPVDLGSDAFKRTVKVGLLATGGLVLADLFTGDGFWTHWVVLVALVVSGLIWGEDILDRESIGPLPVRTVILSAGLIGINLFSWSGHAWALWPVGALILVALIQKVSKPSD